MRRSIAIGCAICILFVLTAGFTGADAKKKRKASTLPDTTVTHQACLCWEQARTVIFFSRADFVRFAGVFRCDYRGANRRYDLFCADQQDPVLKLSLCEPATYRVGAGRIVMGLYGKTVPKSEPVTIITYEPATPADKTSLHSQYNLLRSPCDTERS